MNKFWSRQPTFCRWVDIMLYSLVASFIAAYFSFPIADLTQTVLEGLFGRPIPMAVQIAYCLFILILLAVVHFSIRFRWKHFSHLRLYPPLAISIFIGLSLSSLWPSVDSGMLLPNAERSVPFYFLPGSYALFLILIVIFQRSTADLSNLAASSKTDGREESKNDRYSWENYETWLADDNPIGQPEGDWFGHSEIAQACFERLVNDGHSIALHGPYGSGKTGICRMIERLSVESERRLIFATVSCWGFESSKSAQHHILDAILSEVCEEVDSLHLQGLPQRYIDIIGSHSKPVASILRLFQASENPVDLLCTFEPVLEATKMRLVLIIEDLDRNEANFNRGEIVALLHRLRRIKNISVILAIAPDHQLDFLKVCDHFEPVPKLSRPDIGKRIEQYRRLLLEHYPPAAIFDKLEPLEASEFDMAQLERNPNYRAVITLLSNIIATPRQFKGILRGIRGQWEALCGEVRIDDLIVINALRYAEPAAFYFLVRNQSSFQAIATGSNGGNNHASEVRKKLLDELTREWLSVVDELKSDRRSVQGLIGFIDRNSSPIFGESAIGIVPKQSLSDAVRGYIYARRLFSGRLTTNECLDQRVTGLIEEAKSSREAAYKLAEIITYNKEASNSYLAFYESLGFQNHFVLISCVYEVMRSLPAENRLGNESPGFLAASKVYRHQVPDEVNEWLTEEVEKCIPCALWLMTDIFTHWCRQNSPRSVMRASNLVPIQATGIRKSIREKMMKSWEQMTPEAIANSFEGARAYTLFHIVFTVDYEDTTGYYLNDATDWQWMKEYLWEATRASPKIMLPQLFLLVMKDGIRRSGTYSYAIDEKRFDLFIDASREDFFSFVSNCNPTEITKDPSIGETLKVALEYCHNQM